MIETNSQVKGKTKPPDRQHVLLSMHEFYSKEAMHQRQMMWDSVKWTTFVLGAIVAALTHFLPDYLKNVSDNIAVVVFDLAVVGWLASIACLSLLRSFYKTNLKYISMFSKIEDELGFDFRTSKKYFPKDDSITWGRYKENRFAYSKSEDFVINKLSYKSLGMYSFISLVFFVTSVVFLILSVIVLWYWSAPFRFAVVFVYSISVITIFFVFYFGIIKKL